MSPIAARSDAARPEPETPSGIPEDARKRFELLQECRELVISRLAKVVGEALVKMGESLGAVPAGSGDADQQQVLAEAAGIVQQSRTEIALRFRRAFIDGFERRLFNQHGAPAAAEPGELSLVDDREMQTRLAGDRLVHRVRATLDPDEVLGMRARLAVLLEREWFDESQHPVAPEAVFDALKVALSELAPRPEVLAALLDAFEPHLSANLNYIYIAVNERLKAHQVLPRIRPQVAVQSAQKRTGPGDARSAEPADGGGQAQGTGATGRPAGGLSMAPGDGAPNKAAAMPIMKEVQAILARLSQGVPTARASGALMLSDPAVFGVADLPFAPVEPPLLEALSSLQVSASRGAAVPTRLLADLTDHTRDKGSPLDQLTVEIVSMVFDYIYADKRLADGVKQQLLRLQVVAVKAALIDRSFFARRAHPMRRLIDRISDLAADPEADLAASAELVKGIEAVVESVLQSFDQDLAVFDRARDRIEQLAAAEQVRCAERLAFMTREAQRRESLAQALELARARLADRIDADTPVFLSDFLRQVWVQVMARAQVDGGVAAFEEAVTGAEMLIWTVTPKLPGEVAQLAALLPKLIGSVVKSLAPDVMAPAARDVFLNELLQSHTRAIAAAKQPSVPGAPARSVHVAMRPDGQLQFRPLKTAPIEQALERMVQCRTVRLETLKRGAAIELRASDGQWRAFKLSWVSPLQRLYVLSRFPDEARSLDRAQLAELFDARHARVLDARGSVDQALDHLAAPAGAAPNGSPAAASGA